MQHQNKPCIRPYLTLHRLRGNISLSVCLRHTVCNPRFRQTIKRSHDRIVLHSGYDHMIPGTKETGKQHIQRPGNPRRKNNPPGISPMKQPRKTLPRIQNHLRHLVRTLVTPTVDIKRPMHQQMPYRLRNTRCLRKRSTAVVKIDKIIHKNPPLFCLIFRGRVPAARNPSPL